MNHMEKEFKRRFAGVGLVGTHFLNTFLVNLFCCYIFCVYMNYITGFALVEIYNM